MVAAITCTITPPPDCLARLAACPALPRGERMPWVWMRTDDYPAMKRKMRQRSFFTRFPEAPVVDMLSFWRSMARPLRVARERLREAREEAENMRGHLCGCMGDGPCGNCGAEP